MVGASSVQCDDVLSLILVNDKEPTLEAIFLSRARREETIQVYPLRQGCQHFETECS